MNTLEADADLLSACRTRGALVGDIEHAEHLLAMARVDAMLAGDGLLEPLAEPEDEAAALAVLVAALGVLDRQIAEAVANHLLNPVTPPQPLMALPTRAPGCRP